MLFECRVSGLKDPLYLRFRNVSFLTSSPCKKSWKACCSLINPTLEVTSSIMLFICPESKMIAEVPYVQREHVVLEFFAALGPALGAWKVCSRKVHGLGLEVWSRGIELRLLFSSVPHRGFSSLGYNHHGQFYFQAKSGLWRLDSLDAAVYTLQPWVLEWQQTETSKCGSNL